MINLWNDAEAEQFPGPLGQRVYSSRLLGRDRNLVLHGGGNTSVKITETDLFGQPRERLYIKGSGWDLEFIEAEGFAAVDLAAMRRLTKLESLSDSEMVNALKTHTTRADAPTPSVETLLHAIIPFTFVDHTHADVILSITNTEDGETRIRELYGDRVVIVPYIMPGFDLARWCACEFPRRQNPQTIGMILLNHGIFSFGATAKESYLRMVELIDLAEDYLQSHEAFILDNARRAPLTGRSTAIQIAELRRELSHIAGRPMILRRSHDPRSFEFANRPDVQHISQRGPATPDHIIRTKRVPMLGLTLPDFVADYQRYFHEHASGSDKELTMLDPAPRVILDPGLGMVTAGQSARDAAIVAEIYQHTIEVILRAERLGGYRALAEKDLFDMEYWELEQAKLKRRGQQPPFTGEVVLITGAASGIGRACVERFLEQGAAVIGIDINSGVETLCRHPAFVGLVADVTDTAAVCQALYRGVDMFGGIDMAVLNAGLFPAGTPIHELADSSWRHIMNVNVDANLALMRELHPFLVQAPKYGRVVAVGSKNVPAPGPGAAAYSASKAALTQLMRVAALEWARDGIRINTVHPNAVFDTGIWTDGVLAARARQYGMTVDEYKRNNLLNLEVTSADVARMVTTMCGDVFAKSTGTQVPLDGGNERVI